MSDDEFHDGEITLDDSVSSVNQSAESQSQEESFYLEGSLVQRGGTIGYLDKDKKFHPRSNFEAKVVGHLKLEDHVVGYLFSIKRIDEGTERRAFLTNTDCASSSQILKCLNKCFHHRGLWIPKDNRLDPSLPLLFQSLIKRYMNSTAPKKQYYPVTVIGRQPSLSNVWVINKSIQINNNGVLIPESNREYVFETTLLDRISTPISLGSLDSGESLLQLMSCMKELFQENYYNSLFMLAGMAMSVHAELIYEHRHAMPMVIAIGEPKSGKSTALECAASLTGVGIFGTGSGFPFASVMEHAHTCTMGYCIDDIKDDKLLHDIVIATYNKGGYVNMAAGRKVPKSSPVMTSNWSTDKERISSRLAFVPFKVPASPLKGRERMLKEKALSAAQAQATKSVGLVIRLGSIYLDHQDYMYGELAEWVLSVIGETKTREAINYAETIYFLTMLCETVRASCLEVNKEIPDDWPTEASIKAEFVASIANANNSAPTPTTGISDTNTTERIKKIIVDAAENSCPLEFLTYILPKVIYKGRNGEGNILCIAVNWPMFTAKHRGAITGSSEEIRQKLEGNGILVPGAHTSHFLVPGYNPASPTLPVKIKRSGEGKNSKSMTCVYFLRSSFSLDELAVIDSLTVKPPKRKRTAAENAQSTSPKLPKQATIDTVSEPNQHDEENEETD